MTGEFISTVSEMPFRWIMTRESLAALTFFTQTMLECTSRDQ